jgi:hypothetical protein
MGTFNANILPTTTGLSLGSSTQQWLLNGTKALVSQVNPIPFSASPVFLGTSPFSIFTMTLTGNVTSSSLNVPIGLVIFQFTQDSTGSRTFVWPASVNGAATVQGPANQVFTQIFYYDGTNAWALGPGVTWP